MASKTAEQPDDPFFEFYDRDDPACGILYVEVHTTEDPGCALNPNPDDSPVSETAERVINHFPPGMLIRMAVSQIRLRVLRYEERFEWDYTHGPCHKHAKAVLLATARGANHPWYGYPLAFPRRDHPHP